MALPLSAPTLTPTMAIGGSTPASKRPCSTPTWAAPRAPPPPSTHVRRVGPKITSPRLGALFPGCEVALLLLGQGVDRDPHRAQLQPGHLGVDVVWHVVHAPLELARIPRHVLRTQRLVGKAHVHHRRRVTLRGREIDQPTFRQHVEPTPVAELVLLNARPHLPDPGRDVVERLQVDLRVEVPGVG